MHSNVEIEKNRNRWMHNNMKMKKGKHASPEFRGFTTEKFLAS